MSGLRQPVDDRRGRYVYGAPAPGPCRTDRIISAMNNIEAAFVLIRAEANKRIKDADHHDYVGTVHEVMLEVNDRCGQLMIATRELEKKNGTVS